LRFGQQQPEPLTARRAIKVGALLWFAFVFTTWSTLKAGDSTNISFDYSHRLFLLPAEGVGYQFVFEKQAGTVRNYVFDINAPLGYQFAENGISSYEYKSDDMPGRVIINLTLAKLSQ